MSKNYVPPINTALIPLGFRVSGAVSALTAAAIGVVPRDAVYETCRASQGTASSSGASSITLKKNGTTVLTLSWAATTGVLTTTWADTTDGGRVVVAAGDVMTADIVAGTGSKDMAFVLDA